MSPLEIKIMLHYYAMPTAWEGDSDAEVIALGDFIRNGMLGCDKSDTPKHFITHKGYAYVDKLLSIPVPTERVTYSFEESGE